MKKILIIAAKELGLLFRSPIAYVALIVMMCVFNVFFYMIVSQNQEASLRDIFKVMEFMFIFFIPLLTMKVFSEEYKSGSIEFLMTAPVTNTAIVCGKYLGSLLFFTLFIGLTFVYYIILEVFSAPDQLAVLSGYFGVWCEGAFFLSIGVMTSSWTRNQIIAAIFSYIIILSLYMVMTLLPYLNGSLEGVVRYMCTLTHIENFVSGIIHTSDVVYYLTGVVVCLMLTQIKIENRLWR
ncbi:ABC transporter permease [Candidatus Omnitrophota bacterium]